MEDMEGGGEVGTGRLAGGAIVDLDSAEWVGICRLGCVVCVCGWLGLGWVVLWVWVWMWMWVGGCGSVSFRIQSLSQCLIGNWPRRSRHGSPKRAAARWESRGGSWELRAESRELSSPSAHADGLGRARTRWSWPAKGIEGCITSHARYRHCSPPQRGMRLTDLEMDGCGWIWMDWRWDGTGRRDGGHDGVHLVTVQHSALTFQESAEMSAKSG